MALSCVEAPHFGLIYFDRAALPRCILKDARRLSSAYADMPRPAEILIILLWLTRFIALRCVSARGLSLCYWG